MTFEEYQNRAHTTSTVARNSLQHATNGLFAESGEIAGVLQKFERGDFDEDEVERRIFKELGDVLWYASEVCTVFGFSLEQVAMANLEKLAARYARGVIKGSGDDR